MANYYILDEHQYYVLMNMAMQNNEAVGVKVPDDISEGKVCGRRIKKAELSPYSIFFEETKDPNTGETIITGLAGFSARSVISPELMLDHPEPAREVAKEKICKSMADCMIEQLTWRFIYWPEHESAVRKKAR